MILAGTFSLQAQETGLLRLTVVPRILEGSMQVIWEQTLVQDTMPGRAIVVNLEAGAVSVRLTITPYEAPESQILLVVQGLVRQSDKDGVNVRTSLQSLLASFGERVVYFPLGRNRSPAGQQMTVELRIDRMSE